MQKQKIIFSLLLSILVSFQFSLSNAQGASPKIPLNPKTNKTALTAPVAETAPSYYESSADINITASFGVINEQIAFGPGFQVEWPVVIEGNAFAFGGQTGFLYSFRSQTIVTGTLKSRAWSIPVLVTAKYKFKSNIDFLKPYFAVGVGLSVDHAGGDVNVAGINTTISDTNVHFALLARPGLTLGHDGQWFIEIPFGVLFKEFSILPSVGYHF